MYLGKAISMFFKVLKEGDGGADHAPRIEADVPSFSGSPDQAVQVLGLLQKEGRLVDFLMEDISGHGDDDIGAAVRDIHSGCRKVLDKHFKLRRIMTESEGSTVTIAEDFDASAVELGGNVSGTAPFKGELVHAGWYADEVDLPTVPEGADTKVVAPAQVTV